MISPDTPVHQVEEVYTTLWTKYNKCAYGIIQLVKTLAIKEYS